MVDLVEGQVAREVDRVVDRVVGPEGGAPAVRPVAFPCHDPSPICLVPEKSGCLTQLDGLRPTSFPSGNGCLPPRLESGGDHAYPDGD